MSSIHISIYSDVSSDDNGFSNITQSLSPKIYYSFKYNERDTFIITFKTNDKFFKIVNQSNFKLSTKLLVSNQHELENIIFFGNSSDIIEYYHQMLYIIQISTVY